MTAGSGTRLAGDVWQFLDGDRCVDDLRSYFEPSGDSASGWKFSGAMFERFAGGGDAPGVRDVLAPADIVAVSFLSVSVPGHAAIALLGGMADQISQLLAAIPTDVDLYDPDAGDLVAADSAASTLWTLIERLDGIGWVTAGKLLARKRPRLIPVYDSVVKDALQPNDDRFWSPLHAELQDPVLVSRLDEIRSTAGVGSDISLLRVLDVVVWMRNRSDSESSLDFKPRTA